MFYIHFIRVFKVKAQDDTHLPFISLKKYLFYFLVILLNLNVVEINKNKFAAGISLQTSLSIFLHVQ